MKMQSYMYRQIKFQNFLFSIYSLQQARFGTEGENMYYDFTILGVDFSPHNTQTIGTCLIQTSTVRLLCTSFPKNNSAL